MSSAYGRSSSTTIGRARCTACARAPTKTRSAGTTRRSASIAVTSTEWTVWRERAALPGCSPAAPRRLSPRTGSGPALRLDDRVEFDHLLLDLGRHVGLDVLIEERLVI